MRRALLLIVVLAGQAFAPLPSSAQAVDPCEPVPVPELCDVPLPTPGPSPSPDPLPDGEATGEDEPSGRQGGGRQQREGRKEPRDPEPAPFYLGGPKSTLRLMSILSVLPRFGMPLREAVLEVAGPFPVAGLAWWTNDWHACRDGCRRRHEGLDMFAPAETPLVATADGIVSQKAVGGLAGISVEVTDDRGVQYFYAHLSRWPDGLRQGMRVRRGQVIGFVGNTGNAMSTPPHLHLEIQPNGKPVPPKPFVDRWLKGAEQRAIGLVERITGRPVADVFRTETDFRLTRLFDLDGGLGTSDLAAGQLLLLTGLQPAAPSLPVASSAAGQMAWEIDWREEAEAQLALLAEEYQRLLAEQQLSAGLPMGLALNMPQTTERLAGGFD